MRQKFAPILVAGGVTLATISGGFAVAARAFALRDTVMTTDLSNFRDSERYGKYSVLNLVDILKGAVSGASEKITGPLPDELPQAPEKVEMEEAVKEFFGEALEVFTPATTSPLPPVR